MRCLVIYGKPIHTKMFAMRSALRHSLKVYSMQWVPLRYDSTSRIKAPKSSLFGKHLALVNSLTSGIFMGLGDFVQQEIEYQYKILPQRYDWARMSRMFIAGVVLGPLHHIYYMKIDKILPGSTHKDAGLKVLADQLICSPITIVIFFYTLAFLEKKSLKDSNEECNKKFLYVYLGDWLFWPPVQYINFYYLPTQYRVMYINGVTAIFNVFLSFIKHKEF